ncbi:hypothetical protein [Nostoc sp. C117]|uniref:hypothetical protein n=1 Tax=Nostoc sp. C117 TaxID=3349875 RepID=UPI00370D7B24
MQFATIAKVLARVDSKFFSFQNSVDAIAPLPSQNRKKPAFHLQGHLFWASESPITMKIANPSKRGLERDFWVLGIEC